MRALPMTDRIDVSRVERPGFDTRSRLLQLGIYGSIPSRGNAEVCTRPYPTNPWLPNSPSKNQWDSGERPGILESAGTSEDISSEMFEADDDNGKHHPEDATRMLFHRKPGFLLGHAVNHVINERFTFPGRFRATLSTGTDYLQQSWSQCLSQRKRIHVFAILKSNN